MVDIINESAWSSLLGTDYLPTSVHEILDFFDRTDRLIGCLGNLENQIILLTRSISQLGANTEPLFENLFDGNSVAGELNALKSESDLKKEYLHPASANTTDIAEGIDKLILYVSRSHDEKEVATLARTSGLTTAGVALSSVGEASATLGLPGAQLGTTVIVVSGLLSYLDDIDAEEKRKRKIVNEVRSSLHTFSMSKSRAANYLQSTRKIDEKFVRAWQMPFNPVHDNVVKYGKHAYDLNIPQPVLAKDNTAIYLPASHLPEKMPAQYAQSYLEQTFDLQQNLISAGLSGGRQRFDQVALGAIKESQEYDKQHHTATTKIRKSAVQESLFSLLTYANKDILVQGDYWDNSAKPQLRNKLNRDFHGVPNPRVYSKPNIIINKALIENFTINVRDSGEGVNALKHQVEEALISILENVTTTP